MDDVAAMIAGKTGKIMPMDEESPSNCSTAVGKKMIEQVGK